MFDSDTRSISVLSLRRSMLSPTVIRGLKPLDASCRRHLAAIGRSTCCAMSGNQDFASCRSSALSKQTHSKASSALLWRMKAATLRALIATCQQLTFAAVGAWVSQEPPARPGLDVGRFERAELALTRTCPAASNTTRERQPAAGVAQLRASSTPSKPARPTGKAQRALARNSRTGVGLSTARPTTCQPRALLLAWKRSSSGNSVDAGRAPGGPEVQQQRLAAQVGHDQLAAFGPLEALAPEAARAAASSARHAAATRRTPAPASAPPRRPRRRPARSAPVHAGSRSAPAAGAARPGRRARCGRARRA